SCPGPLRQQLQGDDGIDGGLPDDALCPVVAHRVRVVAHVVQIHRTRLTVPVPTLARAGDVDAGTGLAFHAGTDGGGVRQDGGDDVARADLHTLHRNLLGAVQTHRLQHLEHADH